MEESRETDKTDTIKKKLLAALEKSMGIVSVACKKAKTSRQTFYKYCNEDTEFKQKVDDIGEMAIDFVESKLLNNISQGAETSIIFFLKTKGKKRGYSEKVEVAFDPNVKPLSTPWILFDPATGQSEDLEIGGA